MKLIVGLGNPGKEYVNTRHNIGFMFVDNYLKYINNNSDWKKKFSSYYLKTKIRGEDVIFLKPQTYMNLSGDAVKDIMDYFNIDINDILVISDDLDLKIGNFKLKRSGSCGGHNGLKDIENKLHSACYKRMKIGISNDKTIETKDYVLGKLSSVEIQQIAELFSVLDNVIDDYLSISFEKLMNKYNKKNN